MKRITVLLPITLSPGVALGAAGTHLFAAQSAEKRSVLDTPVAQLAAAWVSLMVFICLVIVRLPFF